MPRIPYQPLDLQEPKELVDAIRARRGGRLLNLDRILLYSPPLAKGWNTFLRAVRTELTLSPKLMEIAICTVAVVNRAQYEFHHHAPELVKAGGTPAQVEALHALDGKQADATAFDAAERAVIRFTVELTREVEVSDATFAAVKQALSDRQVVELTGVVAAYNMVSRVLVALGVEPE
jgi:alkylhydroperoxidase family enzyme